MQLIRNPSRDEIRDGTIVTVRQKKFWDVALNLIFEFQKICAHHNLKWFATAGTLLAAVKYHGFNPNDMLLSFAMLRSDYDKFRKIARSKMHYPFLFDPYYDHDYPPDRTSAGGWPVHPLIKIRDERTMMLEFPKWKDLPQGIWIDVSPLDSFPPFEDQKMTNAFEILKLIYQATFAPKIFQERLEKEEQFLISKEQLKNFVELPYQQRAKIFENNCGNLYRANSKYLGTFLNQSLIFERSWFEKIEWIPFENSAIPIPYEYEKILKVYYADYPNTKLTREIDIWSPDISYREYFEKVTL